MMRFGLLSRKNGLMELQIDEFFCLHSTGLIKINCGTVIKEKKFNTPCTGLERP